MFKLNAGYIFFCKEASGRCGSSRRRKEQGWRSDFLEDRNAATPTLMKLLEGEG
ncbi:MAG: hypothetical protein LBU32_15665 [Clostridiales bacterium]|jgi:hypothetical protein|nr:hypothetical protein [Clostridiales bacterium]